MLTEVVLIDKSLHSPGDARVICLVAQNQRCGAEFDQSIKVVPFSC